MSELSVLLETSAQMRRAEVTGVEGGGTVLVSCAGDETARPCDVLQSGGAPLRVEPGDPVLCWFPSPDAPRGVLLGRIGGAATLESPTTPDELVLEAKEQLTIKCGDGSITIRADGKVLIKGKDLVSHAQRTNRVKGGTVAIN